MNDNILDLINKAKQGDNIAISELMNQYNSELFNLAKMYSSSDSDAEDALQNTYIRAFRNLSSLEDVNKFDSWIKQITIEEAQRLNKNTSTKPQVPPQNKTTSQPTNPVQRRFDPMTGKPIGKTTPGQPTMSIQAEPTINIAQTITTRETMKGGTSIIIKVLIGCLVLVCVIGGYFVIAKTGILDDIFKKDSVISTIEEEKQTPEEIISQAKELGKTQEALNLLLKGYEETGDKALKKEYDKLYKEQWKLKTIVFCTTDGIRDVFQKNIYNSSGELIERTMCGDLGCKILRYEYEYDFNGNQIKRKDYDSDDWDEYEYDSNGNQVKETRYNSDGSISSWSEYEYDSDGNQVKKTTYYSNGRISSWNEYEYDSDGNQIKTTHYNSDGSIWRLGEPEYDTNDNIIKETFYHPDEKSVAFWDEYEYEFIPFK